MCKWKCRWSINQIRLIRSSDWCNLTRIQYIEVLIKCPCHWFCPCLTKYLYFINTYIWNLCCVDTERSTSSIVSNCIRTRRNSCIIACRCIIVCDGIYESSTVCFIRSIPNWELRGYCCGTFVIIHIWVCWSLYSSFFTFIKRYSQDLWLQYCIICIHILHYIACFCCAMLCNIIVVNSYNTSIAIDTKISSGCNFSS